jgi:hypothetical protein
MSDLALCSFAMDRGELVVDVLRGWLKHDIFKYYVIVDWYSRTSLYNHVKDVILKSGKKNVYVIRVLDKELFYITKARNLCMRFLKSLGNTSHTLIIDSDVVIQKGIDINMLNDRVLWDKSNRCLHGTVLMPTQCFWDVNGYWEKITYWQADHDFIRRVGEKYEVVDNGLEGKLYHINHVAVAENKRLKKFTDKIDINEVSEWQNNGVMESLDCEVYYWNGKMERKVL